MRFARRASVITFLTAVLTAVLPLQTASGQGRSQGNPGTATPPGTTSPTPPPGTTNNPPGQPQIQPQPQQQQQQQTTQPPPQVIYVSGRVLVDDGTVPEQPGIIETVCNGSPHGQAYTDSKGRFSFELGGRSRVMQDASEGSSAAFNPMPGVNGQAGRLGPLGAGPMLNDCSIRAKIPGYRSDELNLTGERFFGNPDVGTIFVHRLGEKVEGRVVSITTLAAPKAARKEFDKGREALEKKKPEDAEKHFRKAVEAYPEYSVAWCELGKLQMVQGRNAEATASLEAAIRADSNFVQPYLAIALIHAVGRDWNKLAAVTEQAIKLDAYDFPQAYFFNAMAKFNLHDLEAAEKMAREGQRIDPRHSYPRLWEIAGLVLANRGKYSEAAEQLRAYLQYAPQAQDNGKIRGQLAQMEKLAGAVSVARQQE